MYSINRVKTYNFKVFDIRKQLYLNSVGMVLKIKILMKDDWTIPRNYSEFTDFYIKF
jgi:hypothetical protein